MRAFLFYLPFFVLFACGGKNEDSPRGSGGQVGSGGASTNTGGASATSGSTSSGGDIATSGAATGGTNAAGETSAIGGKPADGEAGFTSGGAAPSAGAGTTGGMGGQGTGGQALVSCDLRNVLCKSVQPSCPENQVPSVNGSCYGPCVPIESCACSAAAECPMNDRYTCWQRTHCGPYVK